MFQKHSSTRHFCEIKFQCDFVAGFIKSGYLQAPGRWSHSEGGKKCFFFRKYSWLIPSLLWGKMPPTTDGYEYRQPKRLCLYQVLHMAPDSLTRLSKQLLCTFPTCHYKALQTASEFTEEIAIRWFSWVRSHTFVF